MGIIALQPAAVRALLAFGAAPYNAKGTIADAVARGAVAFDLYLELLSACLPHLDFARYSERLAGRSPLPPSILRALFDAVHPFTLTAQLTRATTFLHFGNLPDFAHACRELHTKELHPFYAQEREELRVQCTPELVQFNAINIALPTRRGKSICVENADGVKLPNACGNNLFFGLREWSSSIVIPEGICLDMRTTDDGTYTLVYGVHDTFKPAARLEELIFCGCPFDRWLRERGLTPQDVWDERDQGDLLAARLFFPEAEDDFIAGYWRAPVDGRWGEVLLKRPRVSLAECNARSDAARRDAQRMQVRTRLLRDLFQQGMGWKNCSLHDLAASLDEGVTLAHLRATCAHTDDVLLKVYRQAHVTALAPADARTVFDAGFAIDYLGARDREPLQLGVKEDQIVWARAPLRLDLAGGWSDTPPYTLRHGGQVVNLAVNLNGQPPIQVFCRRTATRHIVLHSIDLGVSQCIAEFAQLENYGDPSAVFALPKAALCLLGFTHAHGTSLDACLAQLGSGLELTVLCAVPKGSGLGTSSILTGVILAALHRFLGRPCLLDELFRQVLQIEQMLTTGGGWQDQIGGIVGGVKYIESKPGLKPSPVVHQLDPFLFAQPDARACMTLFYTGITRLAKNILGDVVAQVNYNTPAYLFTLDYLRHLAREARDAISLRSLPRLATIISTSWQANKRIHASTTNDEVERLMQETAAHYSGVKLLGAGGGGYALFISPDATQAEALRALLHARFENNKARIVDMALNLDGLQVSVS
jgi:galactokinase/mevalonate kinase-like predicted kinase